MKYAERFVPVCHRLNHKATWYVWDNMKNAYGNAKLFGEYPTKKMAQCRIDNVMFLYKDLVNEIP